MYLGGSFGKPGFTNTVPDHTFAANGNSPDNYSFTTPDGTCVQMDSRSGTQKIIATTPQGDYVSISQTGLIEVRQIRPLRLKRQRLFRSRGIVSAGEG